MTSLLQREKTTPLPTLTPELQGARWLVHLNVRPRLASGRGRSWMPAWGPQCLWLDQDCGLCPRLRYPDSLSDDLNPPPSPTESVDSRPHQQWKGQPGVWGNLVGVASDSGRCGTPRPPSAQPGAVVTAGEADVCRPVYAPPSSHPPPHPEAWTRTAAGFK